MMGVDATRHDATRCDAPRRSSRFISSHLSRGQDPRGVGPAWFSIDEGQEAVVDVQTIMGLVFTYAVMASICSGISEWFNSLLKTRPKFLRKTIEMLLPDTLWKEIASKIFVNPMLQSVVPQDRAKRLSYIEPNVFVDCVFDIIDPADPSKGQRTVEQLRSIVSGYSAGPTRTFLLSLIDQSGGDLAKLRQGLANYYAEAMDRASGLFKNHSQFRMFWISLVVCLGMNIDAIEMFRTMAANSPQNRELMMTELRELAKERLKEDGSTTPEQDVEQLRQMVGRMTLPIGWTMPPKVSDSVQGEKRQDGSATPSGSGKPELPANVFADSPSNGNATSPAAVPATAAPGPNPTPTAPPSVEDWWFNTVLPKAVKQLEALTPMKAVGFLFSTVILTMMAPFSFELLNTFVNVRAAGPKPGDAIGRTIETLVVKP